MTPQTTNDLRRAALDARAQYIGELLAANLAGDDVDRESADWLRRLVEVCGAYAHVEGIASWYAAERKRLERLQ